MKSLAQKMWAKPVAIALISSLPAAGAFAENIAAQSEGYGLQVQAEVLNLVSIDVLNGTPGQYASGSAPAPYNVSSGLVMLDADAGTGIGPVLGTSVALDLLTADGVLSATALSDVNGTGSRSSSSKRSTHARTTARAPHDTTTTWPTTTAWKRAPAIFATRVVTCSLRRARVSVERYRW